MIKNMLLRHPWLLFLFSFSYVIFLVASIPAAQLFSRMPLPSGLQLQNVQGSLWQGRIGELRWQKYQLHDLEWEVLFSRLWFAKPTLRLTLHDPNTAIATGLISWRGHWSLQDWQITTAAEKLQPWIPVSVPIQASGPLTLQLDELAFNGLACEAGTGQAHWQQALLQTPAGELALGNPSASLHCEDQKLKAQAQQTSASLQSKLTFQLAEQGQFKLQASLQPKSELTDNLRSTLTWLGAIDKNGIIQIKEEGKLSYY